MNMGTYFPSSFGMFNLSKKMQPPSKVVSLSSTEGLGHGTCQPLTLKRADLLKNASELIFEIGGFSGLSSTLNQIC